MKKIIKSMQCLLTLAIIITFSGCSLFYELSPHRLQRLNQGEGMSKDAYYSVSDNSFKMVESKQTFKEQQLDSDTNIEE